MKQQSEFGKGFIYNLILFSKHWWRHFDNLKINDEMAESNPDLWEKGYVGLWFNAAADHFFEIEIPKEIRRTNLGKKLQGLVDTALEYRSKDATKEQFNKWWKEFEDVIMELDKKLFDMKDIEADYK